MLTRGAEQNLPSVPSGGQWPLGLGVATVLAIALLTAVLDSEWPRDTGEVTIVSLETLAGALFRDWLLPFEVVSIVLLVALVGAVILSHEDEREA
jgi:NADH-quinone oxidoreductase subunit J